MRGSLIVWRLMATLSNLCAIAVFLAANPASATSVRPAALQAGKSREVDKTPLSSESLRFTGFVVDQARLMGTAEEHVIAGWLDRFQQMTGHEMAVVTVRSLAGEDIAPFTTRLANRWGVGRKGLNDGIVLLIAPAERKVRIAVGLGLQSDLTDTICASIIDQRIVPAFSKGKMFGGIEAGVIAIISHFISEPVPPVRGR